MRVLVITSCTGEKVVSSNGALTLDNFALGPGLELELPRLGGHSIIGHAMLVRRCSRVSHPPGLPSGIQG